MLRWDEDDIEREARRPRVPLWVALAGALVLFVGGALYFVGWNALYALLSRAGTLSCQ